MRFPKPYSVQCNTRAEHQSTTRDTPLHDRYIALPPSLASVRTLTHGGELVIARVPLLARCGGVVCLLA